MLDVIGKGLALILAGELCVFIPPALAVLTQW